MIRRLMEPRLREWWRGGGGVGGALYRGISAPLAGLFGVGVGLRNRGFDLGILPSGSATIPVISIGNLAVGGAGKTPFTRWVVEALLEGGARPGVVSRGYGEDEPALHRQWYPRVPVVLSPRRLDGVRTAAAEGAEVAVLDDAFQHRALRRDLDIVLLAAEHPFPIRLLPAGPYRETMAALRRAHVVVVTRRVAPVGVAREWLDRVRRGWPHLTVASLRFAPGSWTTLEGGETDAPVGPLLAASGVAAPEGFARMVEQSTGAQVELMAFPDHHRFTAGDLREVVQRARGRTVVITQKDAVKWLDLPEPPPGVRVLSLTPVFDEGEAAVRAALHRTLQENSTHGP
jgi:tetraacyldisaccharide 4'-kinase